MKKKKSVKKYPGGGDIGYFPPIDLGGFDPSGFDDPVINLFPHAGNPQASANSWYDYFNGNPNRSRGELSAERWQTPMYDMALYDRFKADGYTMPEGMEGDMFNMAMTGLFAGMMGEQNYNQQQAFGEVDMTPVKGFTGGEFFGKKGLKVGVKKKLVDFNNRYQKVLLGASLNDVVKKYNNNRDIGNTLIPALQYGGMVGTPPTLSDKIRNTTNSGSNEFNEIQTEKNEIIGSPHGDIVDVAAKKLHKHMDTDFVTDTLTAGNYIFSNDKAMQLKKDSTVKGIKLDDIVVGKSAQYYVEGEKPKLPQEYKFNDFAPKGKFTPADYMKVIRKKFPITDLKHDTFALESQVENKISRMPYIEILSLLNESKKTRTPDSFALGGYMIPSAFNQVEDNAITGTMYKDPMLNQDKAFRNNGIYPKHLFTQPSTMKGGANFGLTNSFAMKSTPNVSPGLTFKKGGGVPKAFGGGALAGISAGVGLLSGLFQGLSNRGKINSIEDYYFNEVLPGLNENNEKARDFGIGISLMNRMLMQAPKFDAEYLNMDELKEYSNMAADAQLGAVRANRNLASNSMGRVYSAAQRTGYIDPNAFAAGMSEYNRINGQNNLQVGQINASRYNMLGQIADTSAQRRQGRNQTLSDFYNNANSNMMSGIHGAYSNYLTQDSNILANNFNVHAGIQDRRIGNTNAAVQTGIGAAGAVAQAGMPFMYAQGAVPQMNAPMSTSPFAQSGYNFGLDTPQPFSIYQQPQSYTPYPTYNHMPGWGRI